MEKKLMFPAYVFLESDDEEALEGEIMQYGGGAELLKECGTLLHVQEREESFLQSLCGHTHHLRMSKGVITNGITRITEGPLCGMEERISRIDRHKRLARLEVPESSASGSILAGLEIVEKS